MAIRAWSLAMAATLVPATLEAQPVRAAGDEAAPRAVAQWVPYAHARLDAAARANRPLTPPQKVAWRWRPKLAASLAAGGDVLAVIAAPLDGAAEALLILTEEQLWVAKRVGTRWQVGPGWRLPGALVRPRPRFGRGAMAWDASARELVVQTTARAVAARIGWRDGTWVALGEVTTWPACDGASLTAPDGLGRFGRAEQALWTIVCRTSLTPAGGRRADVAMTLAGDEGKGRARIEAGCPDGPRGGCVPASVERAKVGHAIAIGDLDRDGDAEVATSRDGPYGGPDELVVWSVSAPRGRRYRRLLKGGIAGLAIGDFDGDAVDDLVALVRAPGAAKVELWTFDD